MKIRNVVSLFHGAGCFNVAAEQANIEFDTCYTSEIDNNANIVDKDNSPKNINLGDVAQWRDWDIDWSKVDLVIGGSPCQGFSDSGKGENFKDHRSKLFFEFIDIRDHVLKVNPNLNWMLENVEMKRVWEDRIDSYLGVERVFINSGDHSPCYRPRNYWSNSIIPHVTSEDIGVSDVITGDFKYPASITGRKINPVTGRRDDYNKDLKIIQYLEVQPHDKARCVTTVSKDCVLSALPPGKYPDAFTDLKQGVDWRYPTVDELCVFHGIPIGFFKSVADAKARKMIGLGWNIKTIVHILTSIFNDSGSNIYNQEGG